MRIPKQAVITDEFKCPKYWPDLKPIQYKVCLGRQITKLAGGGNQYPECVGCVSGMTITKHFKDYQPIPKRANKCNWNTDLKLAAANKEKKKRAKMGTSPYSPLYVGQDEPISPCVNCQQILDIKNLVKAQVDFALGLVVEGNLDSAMVRLELLLEEM